MKTSFRALLKARLCMTQNQGTGDGGTCFGDSGGPAFWGAGRRYASAGGRHLLGRKVLTKI
jgi:hypothetical protein